MLMSPSGRPARLHYMANGFRIVSPGDHVLCAATGERVAIEDLRYWSVARQEPYASATIATRVLAGGS